MIHLYMLEVGLNSHFWCGRGVSPAVEKRLRNGSFQTAAVSHRRLELLTLDLQSRTDVLINQEPSQRPSPSLNTGQLKSCKIQRFARFSQICSHISRVDGRWVGPVQSQECGVEQSRECRVPVAYGDWFDLAAGDAYHGDANAVASCGRRQILTDVVSLIAVGVGLSGIRDIHPLSVKENTTVCQPET